MRNRWRMATSALLVLSMLAAACSDDDDDEAQPPAPATTAATSDDGDAAQPAATTAATSDDDGDAAQPAAPATTAATSAAPEPEPAAPQEAVLSNVLRTSENFCDSSLDKEMSELVVGFSQMESEGAWRIAETQSMEDQEGRVAEVIITDAQGDLAKQITDIQDLVNQGVDVILLAPREADGLDVGLDAARDAGIPVLFVDRSHEGVPCEDYVTFMSSDFVEQGRIAGRRLAEATGGVAKIIQLEGSAGADVARDRKDGFDEIVDENPGMELLASQTADFNRAIGQNVASQLLQTHPDVTAFYAHNDEMALGAIAALEAAGLTPGEDVLVVSIDGVRDAFDAIKAGKMLVTVESNPRFGTMAFDTINQMTLGRLVPDRVVIEDRVYDASNVDEHYDLGY